MFSFKTNARRIADKIEQNIPQLQTALIKGMRQGMLAYENKMVREQMTGRPGLKRQTGTLARSWHVRVRRIGNTDARARLATSTKYAKIHQYGGTIRPNKKKYLRFKFPDGHWITVRSVKIPKRLRVIEDFKKSGLPMMRKKMRERAVASLKRSGVWR